MADKKKMSVAEMIAAARKTDGDGDSGTDQESSPAPIEQEAVEQEAAADKPKAAPTKAAKSGERPSIAEMMAMARGEKAAKSEAPKKAAPKKAAASKPAAKAKPKAAVPSGPRDTASILAAARNPNKPGPMSKAEAEAKGKGQPGKPKRVAPPMPTKPDYAKAKAAKTGATKSKDPFDVGRRAMAIGFGALATVFTLWTLATARFMFPNILREPPSQFKVGFPSDFSPGTVETKFKAQFGVWVANGEYNGEPQIYALMSVCTHLGCTPNWLEAEQKFKCPCHGSGFYKDGINFEGPAPRPLERYDIRLADDGQLEIDKSKKFQEEMGQWEDPESFVPV